MGSMCGSRGVILKFKISYVCLAKVERSSTSHRESSPRISISQTANVSNKSQILAFEDPRAEYTFLAYRRIRERASTCWEIGSKTVWLSPRTCYDTTRKRFENDAYISHCITCGCRILSRCIFLAFVVVQLRWSWDTRRLLMEKLFKKIYF